LGVTDILSSTITFQNPKIHKLVILKPSHAPKSLGDLGVGLDSVHL
jgi:hypothetical protein